MRLPAARPIPPIVLSALLAAGGAGHGRQPDGGSDLPFREPPGPFVTERFDFHETRIGNADAVSAHLGMLDPDTGEHRFFWVSILLDPHADGSVLAVHTADRETSAMKTPMDIGIDGNAVPVLRPLTFMARH